VSTSQAFVSDILHSLTRRSSPAETINGSVGWNATKFTPRSCPSRTNLTTASVFPNMSAWFWFARAIWSSNDIACGAECFFRSPEMSQTRTDWSSEAETTRSSFGWKLGGISNDLNVRIAVNFRSTHHVMVVTRHSTDEGSVLPIPYADRLVIRATQYPRKLVVEVGRPNIVQVAVECEEASSSLV